MCLRRRYSFSWLRPPLLMQNAISTPSCLRRPPIRRAPHGPPLRATTPLRRQTAGAAGRRRVRSLLGRRRATTAVLLTRRARSPPWHGPRCTPRDEELGLATAAGSALVSLEGASEDDGTDESDWGARALRRLQVLCVWSMAWTGSDGSPGRATRDRTANGVSRVFFSHFLFRVSCCDVTTKR